MADARTGKLVTSGNQTDIGISVTAESAFGFHAWYRAITLIAQKSAAVPRYAYRKKPGGKGQEEAPDHDVYRLVQRRANEEQTAFQFWLQMTGHVACRGNGYASIWRAAGSKTATELIPMDPDRTHPVRRGGELWYVCFPFGDDASDPGFKVRAADMVHFKGYGFDGLTGYPVWKVAANEVALALAQRRLEANLYKHSGRPSMLIMTDQTLSPKTKDRVRDDWERLHTGLDNAGKTAVLDKGLKATPISLSAEAMGQTAAMQMSLSAVSNFTGVPVSKLGGARSAVSTEQDDRAFINDGLDFYLNLLDDEVTAKLFSEAESNSGMVVISDREAILRPETKTKFEILRIATAGKPFLSQNEAREVIDYPPSEEPDADKLLTPLNMGKGGKANDPTNPADDPAGRPEGDSVNAAQSLAAREAARFALAHATSRMVGRLGKVAGAAAAKGSSHFVNLFAGGSFFQGNASVCNAEFAAAERFAAAVGTTGKPARGEAAAYLLAAVAGEYERLVDDATAMTLVARVASLTAEQLARMPQSVVDQFVSPEGGSDESA